MKDSLDSLYISFSIRVFACFRESPEMLCSVRSTPQRIGLHPNILMVVDLFILMMQSDTVVGLCLNFAALHFVQEIDDMSFLVGKKGFLSRSLQCDCLQVSSLMVPKSRGRLKRRTRQGLSLMLAVIMYIPYGIFVHQQKSGMFICRNLQVQFGDAFLPELAFFSGRFEFEESKNAFATINFRAVYNDPTRTVRLAYCDEESAWTFSMISATDPCNYLVKSSSTTTFDVLEVRDQAWFSWNTETVKVVPVDWFYIACSDCDKNPSICPNRDIGLCINSVCICTPGRFGAECEFGTPTCDSLDIDERTEPLPLEEGLSFPETYEVLRHSINNGTQNGNVVTVHQRPVYYNEAFGKYDLMLFGGRRWMIYSEKSEADYAYNNSMVAASKANQYSLITELLAGMESVTEVDLTGLDNLSNLIERFPNLIGRYRPYFFSEPVDKGTQSDVLEPTGLNWYRASRSLVGWSADYSYPIEVKFLCSKCDPVFNSCLNGGACDEDTQECKCKDYYAGSLCEHPVRCNPPQQECLNNGTCSEWHGYCDCEGPFYGNLCQFEYLPETRPALPP